MDTKLTLKLDDSIIEQAKNYAKQKDTSLSKLIESYLGKLLTPMNEEAITPLVKSLSGAIELPKNLAQKKDYKKHILNKYGK